jgi:hypothetical protein
MRKIASLVCMAAMFCIAAPASFAKTPAATKSGTIVIVFKDGHRQSFNLAEIERVEFPVTATVAAETTPESSRLPSRGRFLGKWKVDDGNGNDFNITLYDDGNAHRSLGNVHGKWVYVNGEARATWDDGMQDAIRKIGSGYQKFAYGRGETFDGTADNVTNARNTTPPPI